jgi:hypothetical protein
MYNALKRLTSLVTMLLEWLVLRVRPSPGVFIAVILIVVEPGALTRQLPPRVSLDAQLPRSRAGRRGHVRPVRSRIRRTKLPLARPHPRTPLPPPRARSSISELACRSAFERITARPPPPAHEKGLARPSRTSVRKHKRILLSLNQHAHARRLGRRALGSCGTDALYLVLVKRACSRAPAPPEARPLPRRAAPRTAPRPSPLRSTHLHTRPRAATGPAASGREARTKLGLKPSGAP